MYERNSAQIRETLLALLADLDQQDGRAAKSQRPVRLDQQAVGRLSRMDALQQQAMAKATQQRRDQMKTRLKAALARLETGEYGYCTICGEEIETRRLEFDPTAPICISCTKG